MTESAVSAPIMVRGVGWVLVALGAVYVVFGVIGLFDGNRGEAVVGLVMAALGVACLAVGRGLLRDSSRAYRAALVLLAATTVLGVGRAVAEADRSLVSQSVLPAIGLAILLHTAHRTHFARRS
jgi:hypothetical protein